MAKWNDLGGWNCGEYHQNQPQIRYLLHQIFQYLSWQINFCADWIRWTAWDQHKNHARTMKTDTKLFAVSRRRERFGVLHTPKLAVGLQLFFENYITKKYTRGTHLYWPHNVDCGADREALSKAGDRPQNYLCVVNICYPGCFGMVRTYIDHSM